MVPQLIIEAANAYRKKYGLAASCELYDPLYIDELHYHDAIHYFLDVPPDSGEAIVYAAENMIQGWPVENSKEVHDNIDKIKAFLDKYEKYFPIIEFGKNG